MEKKGLIGGIIFVFVLLSVIVFLSLLSIHVFYPAYLSVKYSCDENGAEELREKGYVVAGKFDVKAKEVILTEYADERTAKHENIHLVQFIENRLDSCEHPTKLFFDEVEAYFGQYLPNSIYNFFYD